ncbi:MAG: TolB family protein, partial [Verrucomicrobiales bacterium]
MKPSTAALLALTLITPAKSEELSRRTLNNGNLILEDIPEIPQTIVDSLNRYQNVRYAPLLDWTKDSKSLLISTRFGDVGQIHRVDQPGGARHQLTFFAEPVGSVVRRDGSDELTFTMDTGGSEFSQIYLLDPTTGESRMLTDGKSRNGSIRWNRDGSRLAYRSTRRNGKSNDLWVMRAERPEEAKLTLESPDGSYWGAAEWSADGKGLLVGQYVSARDSRIHLLAVDSKELSPLEGGRGADPSVNFPVGYDRDDGG